MQKSVIGSLVMLSVVAVLAGCGGEGQDTAAREKMGGAASASASAQASASASASATVYASASASAAASSPE
jgi:hypothetical protein